MTVLSTPHSGRSSRFAYRVALGSLTAEDSFAVDLGIFSPSSTTFSFVELKFAQPSIYEPTSIPALVSLVTIPDDDTGKIQYQPHFHLSSPGEVRQDHAPADDLLAFMFVTDTRGSVSILHSFSLTRSSHLVVSAQALGTPTSGELWVRDVLSGNIAYP
jgi:hypothetical protein